MKSHILSKFCLVNNVYAFGPGGTEKTATIETSDVDEMLSGSGKTELTRTIETSDVDEYCGPTILTEQVETSDPDEML